MPGSRLAEGDVAPLYVRVRGIFREQGFATVRYSSPNSGDGPRGFSPGFTQIVVRLDSLGPGEPTLHHLEMIVPPRTW